MDKILYDTQTKKVTQILQSYENYIEIDGFPIEPPEKTGRRNVAYYNPDTGKIEWRQEDRPLSVEEQLLQLKQEQETNAQAIQELALAGMGGV